MGARMDNNNEPKGLGGWLILVGLGVVFGPIRLMYEFGPLYHSLFSDGGFEYLTTPGTDAYHPLWGPLLVFEAIVNTVLLLALLIMAYLFFSKHYLFPRTYIAIVVFSTGFIVLDAWLGSLIITDEPMLDPTTVKELSRSLFTAAIWIPYMLVSRRVKATFVEHRPRKRGSADAGAVA